MNGKIESIDLALNALYQRELTTREQLLNEMLRVKMTLTQIKQTITTANSKDKLFQLMKKTTEEELGFFPADRDDFWDIFENLKDIDPIDFTLTIYKNDRTGIVLAPGYLSTYISQRMRKFKPRRILITEAEKHLSGLPAIIRHFAGCDITLTTQLRPMYLLMQLAFGLAPNVNIRFESIYTQCLDNEKYDYIYTLPAFGHKPDEIGQRFLTRDSDGMALENMLQHLTDGGRLDIIVPAKITFASLGYEKLRDYINQHFHVHSIYILPEGTFKPVTAVKTYLLSITKELQTDVDVGMLKLTGGNFVLTDKKTIPAPKFKSHGDWRIEMLLADDDENIRRFKNSPQAKVKLKSVAEVFRGKSILKKDITVGDIAVLNISDIDGGAINYQNLDTINEEERKIKRYQLYTDDVVLSCRGTALKSAVFEAQTGTVIASANLIVIRPREKVLGQYIKIFLESPVGLAMINSFQRGTTMMNINNADIMEMEIPLLPMDKQQAIIDRYNEEQNIYQNAVKKATRRWSQVKGGIYNDLI